MTDRSTSSEPIPHTPRSLLFERSSTDRRAGGVCGGMARHFGWDATLVRCIWVASMFFGPGFVAYLIAWAVLSDDTGVDGVTDIRDKVSHRSGRPNVLRLGVAAIAVLWVFNDLDVGEMVAPALLVAGGAYLLFRDTPGEGLGWRPTTRAEAQHDPTAAHEPTAAADAAPQETSPDAPQDDVEVDDRDPLLIEAERLWDVDLGPVPDPATDAPLGHAPIVATSPPARPLGRFFVGAATLAAGVLALVISATDFTPSIESVIAAALLACGAFLIVSAWYGRARSLIPIGTVLSALLFAAAAITVPLRGGFGEKTLVLTDPTQAEDPIQLLAGTLDLDLNDLDATRLTHPVVVSVAAGELTVIVPTTHHVDIDAHVSLGEITFVTDGVRKVEDGAGVDVRHTVGTPADDEIAPYHLDLDVGFGEITVIIQDKELR